MENQLALIIGVGQRPDDNPGMAITASDAERVASELRVRCSLPFENVATLKNSDASKRKIMEELKRLAVETENNKADLVWLYFSGHGCKMELEGREEYFLICHDTDSEDISNTAIPGKEFVELLNKINSDKLVLLLDCCHAGGIKNTNKSSVPFEANVLIKNPNRMVISASHAEQLSYLSTPVSLFTFALIEGLAGQYFMERDKEVRIFNLALYIRERVYPLSKKSQQPQLDVLEDSMVSNFVIVKYKEGKPNNPFNERFILYDGSKEIINRNAPVEIDAGFREWLQKNVIPRDTTIIHQSHSGTGDNVGRDKIDKSITISGISSSGAGDIYISVKRERDEV